MNKPQTLTAKGVARAALKAYAAGTLTAQIANKRTDGAGSHYEAALGCCVYADGAGHHCAVGSAFTAATLLRIETEDLMARNILSLRKKKIIRFADPDDEHQINELQKAHDAWASEYVRRVVYLGSDWPVDAEQAELLFLRKALRLAAF